MLIAYDSMKKETFISWKNASWYFLFTPHDVIWVHLMRLIDDKLGFAVDYWRNEEMKI